MVTESRPLIRPTAAQPLFGLTILVVEDSRLTCEALRLVSIRSGARLRRADSLAHARRHLMVYRPGCVIVDIGLPDGSGAELLAELAAARPRIDVLLGMSGDPDGEGAAMAAGADGFLSKPLTSVAQVQSAILAHLPQAGRPLWPRPAEDGVLHPDPAAWRDDLHHAAALLARTGGPGIDHATRFLAGVARAAGDCDLSRAVDELAAAPHGHRGGAHPALARVIGLVGQRLQAPERF
ncbi:MAG: response regulator [Rubellimicrobium sp.]|nr:response regulator [Rubellimicrobium sp.]